jgi:hypothetical protein
VDYCFSLTVNKPSIFFLKYVGLVHSGHHLHQTGLCSCQDIAEKIINLLPSNNHSLTKMDVNVMFPLLSNLKFTRVRIFIFFKNSTLGYMTKTLNQIFFFPPPKSEYFFQQHWESEYFFRKKTMKKLLTCCQATITHSLKMDVNVMFPLLSNLKFSYRTTTSETLS